MQELSERIRSRHGSGQQGANKNPGSNKLLYLPALGKMICELDSAAEIKIEEVDKQALPFMKVLYGSRECQIQCLDMQLGNLDATPDWVFCR